MAAPRNVGVWPKKLDALKAFVAAHNRLPTPIETFDGVNVGTWCTTQRSAYKSCRSLAPLTKEKIEALESVPGWWWEVDRDAVWFQKLAALKAFVAAHSRLPNRGETFNGTNVGEWCHTQRQAHRGKDTLVPLKEEQKTALESVPGWWWDRNDVWFQHLDVLKAFVEEHSRLPYQNETFNGAIIGQWCNNQRQSYKKKYRRPLLSEEQKAALESVPGWWWRRLTWFQHIDVLKAFVKKHKRLPARRDTFDGVPIGSWCGTQRGAYRRGVLAEKRKVALEGVRGWRWML